MEATLRRLHKALALHQTTLTPIAESNTYALGYLSEDVLLTAAQKGSAERAEEKMLEAEARALEGMDEENDDGEGFEADDDEDAEEWMG